MEARRSDCFKKLSLRWFLFTILVCVWCSRGNPSGLSVEFAVAPHFYVSNQRRTPGPSRQHASEALAIAERNVSVSAFGLGTTIENHGVEVAHLAATAITSISKAIEKITDGVGDPATAKAHAPFAEAMSPMVAVREVPSTPSNTVMSFRKLKWYSCFSTCQVLILGVTPYQR